MAVRADDLTVSRGDMLIFSGLSLSLSAGESLILTGPNGAGKSTALRAMLGLVGGAEGKASFFSGEGAAPLPLAFAAHYLAHQNAMKPEMTARENLVFWKTLMGDFGDGHGMAVDDAADAVGLYEVLDLPFGFLSAGQKRRIAFARLLCSYRPVWLLDEPTAALDSAAKALFSALMNAHVAAGGIVIAATHEPLDLANAREMRFSGPVRLVADPFMDAEG
ncbi:heme ABC exporter ATP-binding protein CcmA [Martelella soudanensis]|uniref:heme ABC exporter ATP-binding protein CcmA n=1 Tax=unclassified Martelella TaxID=2629616 RepID=UPI0015DF0F32|nr:MULTISPECIES: heme ABC exporter ATP-binding protein CcmA [unclassified Martelella]